MRPTRQPCSISHQPCSHAPRVHACMHVPPAAHRAAAGLQVAVPLAVPRAEPIVALHPGVVCMARHGTARQECGWHGHMAAHLHASSHMTTPPPSSMFPYVLRSPGRTSTPRPLNHAVPRCIGVAHACMHGSAMKSLGALLAGWLAPCATRFVQRGTCAQGMRRAQESRCCCRHRCPTGPGHRPCRCCCAHLAGWAPAAQSVPAVWRAPQRQQTHPPHPAAAPRLQQQQPERARQAGRQACRVTQRHTSVCGPQL